MKVKTKSYLAIFMGIIIFIANTYWLVIGNSYQYMPWLISAIVIYIADIYWIVLDYQLMNS